MFIPTIIFAEIETSGPCVGDTRSRKQFISLPKKLNSEWKFLQYVVIISEYCYGWDNGFEDWCWKDVKWGEMY